MIRYERYEIAGRPAEWMLSLGSDTCTQILIIPPLFEEHNFTRTFVVGIARGLGERQRGAWIPDLPGCGESLRPLAEVSLDDWRAAVAAASDHVLARTGRRPHVAAFRAGAVLDDAASGVSTWRFAPAGGADQLRAMRRAQSIADREAGAESGQLVGYAPGAALIEPLEAAAPRTIAGCRTVDWPAGSAPFWRRAEPAHDRALAETIAADIDAWVAQCGG